MTASASTFWRFVPPSTRWTAAGVVSTAVFVSAGGALARLLEAIPMVVGIDSHWSEVSIQDTQSFLLIFNLFFLMVSLRLSVLCEYRESKPNPQPMLNRWFAGYLSATLTITVLIDLSLRTGRVALTAYALVPAVFLFAIPIFFYGLSADTFTRSEHAGRVLPAGWRALRLMRLISYIATAALFYLLTAILPLVLLWSFFVWWPEMCNVCDRKIWFINPSALAIGVLQAFVIFARTPAATPRGLIGPSANAGSLIVMVLIALVVNMLIAVLVVDEAYVLGPFAATDGAALSDVGARVWILLMAAVVTLTTLAYISVAWLGAATILTERDGWLAALAGGLIVAMAGVLIRVYLASFDWRMLVLIPMYVAAFLIVHAAGKVGKAVEHRLLKGRPRRALVARAS